ncbi:MAG: EAL domain-containing protein [Chromatiaceae bacterium]|jgi:diguanylate cyclase (GGDEF)-like protein/PAS domain S-box-containing protein|nr:EAL domain-containing protein [Chromatiaceae bacterium]
MAERPETDLDALDAGEPVRRTQIALVVCGALLLALLAWSTWSQVQTRLAMERSLATHLTAATADRLRRRLREDEIQLSDHVVRDHDLLDSLLVAPEDASLREQVWWTLQVRFPDVAGALVIGARDIRAVVLGGEVGADSGRFLRERMRGRGRPLRLVAGDTGTYAEVTAPWFQGGGLAGALLIRLPCDGLCRTLNDIETPPGHELALHPRDARDPRQGLLAAAPVGDTGWEIRALLDPAYAADLRGRPLASGLAIALTLLLVLAALAAWTRRQDPHRRQELRVLREADFRLQAVVAATTDGILLTDREGRIELVNPAAEMLFGRLAEDVLDESVDRLIPDFFAVGNAEGLLEADQASLLPVVRETRALGRGGEELPIRLWLTRTRFEDKTHFLAVVQDLTEHQHNEAQLAYLAQRDVLTGLLNRKELERHLAEVLATGAEGGPGPHVLCHLDVDQFKLINERCGHEAGDALLKQLATLLSAKLNGSEVVARLAGDEFALLLPDRGLDAALALCDTLLQTVRSFLFAWRDQSFDVSASIGVVELRGDGETPSSALSKADAACHMAKTHGRDRVHVYQESDAELIRHHGDMRLVATISDALKEGRFHLFAQPILPIAGGAGARLHFEVLVRMRDAQGNAVIPDSFIPAAERYILMPTIDRWVINRLFRLHASNLRAWHSAAPDQFLFAVNLSGTSLADDGFLRYIKRQFSELDIPYPSICFEITETAAVRDLKGACAFMEELTGLGCRFALDDFGAGASSYRYLKELPVDYLKIDGSFVRGMAEDPVDYALVESINQIGHVLRLKTIAEWVEDRNTLSQLRALNVDFAQGYAVGEALPVETLTLDKTLIPPTLRGLTHDGHRGPHRTRREPARSA